MPFVINSNTVLETRGLKKTYMQGKVPVHALRGVDLAFNRGELIAILGPSGSGKSTLLNMIGALDRPTAGTIIMDQVSVSVSVSPWSSLFIPRRRQHASHPWKHYVLSEALLHFFLKS
nr:ATP-binding cassette domain-containing protein [Candidatus Sigynarchaeum springense]